jgi:hypothetical protein
MRSNNEDQDSSGDGADVLMFLAIESSRKRKEDCYVIIEIVFENR